MLKMRLNHANIAFAIFLSISILQLIRENSGYGNLQLLCSSQ